MISVNFTRCGLERENVQQPVITGVLEDDDMASKKTKGKGMEVGSDIQKLVRSEVRKIMEVSLFHHYHTNMGGGGG